MAMKLFFNNKRSFQTKNADVLSECLSFIEDSLSELKIDRKLAMRTILTSEEALIRCIRHAEDGIVNIRVRRRLGDAEIVISANGKPFDFIGNYDTSSDITSLKEKDAERAIRSILLNSLGDKFKYSNKNGINRVRIMAGQGDKAMLYSTIEGLLIGLAFGLIMKMIIPSAVSDSLCYYMLDPLKTMYMNALKIIIAPVVFFSMVTCIAQFKNLSELGRIGAKVMGHYLMTTIFAALTAIGMSILLHPGKPGFALSLSTVSSAAASDATPADTSVLHTLINIVPSNFIRPFLEADTMQIIFLAVLCGIAVGMIGEYSPVLQEFFEACNSLFLTVTMMITHFMPVAVFCSVALMMVQMGGSSFLSVLAMAGTYLLCLIIIMMLYAFLIFAAGHKNPLTFFKKNKAGMITSFTLASASAAMPVNMRTCTMKMGISPKVCGFSIPLGSTVNMDGTSMLLTVAGLFLARAYGVDVPASILLSLMITIVLLSLSSPGVPGAGIVCLGVVLGSLDVPVEAVSLIMGIYPFLDMFNTMSNTTGDVAAALIVASSEGMVDEEVYNS